MLKDVEIASYSLGSNSIFLTKLSLPLCFLPRSILDQSRPSLTGPTTPQRFVAGAATTNSHQHHQYLQLHHHQQLTYRRDHQPHRPHRFHQHHRHHRLRNVETTLIEWSLENSQRRSNDFHHHLYLQPHLLHLLRVLHPHHQHHQLLL